MTIFVLGASGFIGKHLIKLSNESYKFKAISLRNSNWAEEIMEGQVIINLIGRAHDHSGKSDANDFYFSNHILTTRIYESFIKSNAYLLIHISSIAAVEEFESIEPLIETDNCNPRSWYGKSKLAGEQFLTMQNLPQNKKVIILRPPMVHGEGDKGSLDLFYKFISKGIPYPLAAFNSYRSVISIDNFCFFITQIINKHEKIASGVYHVSDDEPISTSLIIETINSFRDKPIAIISLPKFLVRVIARLGDIIPLPLNSKRLKKMTSTLVVSNDKIKAALEIDTLPVSAKDGLLNTLNSFR